MSHKAIIKQTYLSRFLAFTGAGKYYFTSDDLDDYNSSYVGLISAITLKTDLIAATQAVVDWHAELVEEARIGSALGGRPWRFITPGHPLGVIDGGMDGDPDEILDSLGTPLLDQDDGRAYVIQETAKLANEERMYFDMHMHFIADGAADAEAGIEDLTSASAPWADDAPQGVVILEFGPKGDEDDDWWEGHVLQIPLYKFPASNWRDDPDRDWDPFIEDVSDPTLGHGWEKGQFDVSNEFDMSNLMSLIDGEK